MRVFSAAKGEVVAVGFVPGRAAVVAAYESAGVYVWDLSSSDPPVGFGRHEYFRPRSLTFSADGRHLVQSNSTGRVAVDRRLRGARCRRHGAPPSAPGRPPPRGFRYACWVLTRT